MAPVMFVPMSFALSHQSNKNKAGDTKPSTLANHSPYHLINNLKARSSCGNEFYLEQATSNQALEGLTRSDKRGFDFAKIGIIQPKLKISQPGDQYEQEADRVAEQVMRMAVPLDSAASMATAKDDKRIDRKCAACEMNKEDEKQLNISRKPSDAFNLKASDQVADEINRTRSGGISSLDSSTKEFMEPRFGYDFGNVKIHSDKMAARSAESVKASAYTVGNDIVFAEGQYQPNTLEGMRLLAHELTHVVQQRVAINGIVLQRQDASSTSPDGIRSCGPDITSWFVNILNSAKTNSIVLEIKRRLTIAANVAQRYGYSSMDILEGGLARKVLAAERAAGNQPRTTEAANQLRQADPQNQFGRALLAATAPIPFVGAPEQMIFAALKSAGEAWKNLVQTGAIWDFKNNILSGSNLANAACPNQCSNPPTVTICGTCYEHDLPGNLFYASIGRFCGFSLNALQLGSQFAELQPSSSSKWDTPEDTAAIRAGFDLPQNATSANLCAALANVGASVTIRVCPSCSARYSP